MDRAPFDPGRMTAVSKRSDPEVVQCDDALTVSNAAALIQQTVVTALPGRLRVAGQVSNFSGRSHWFFTLKDEEAAIRCVMFASTARRQAIGEIQDGMLVVVTGRVDFYAAQGQLQLYVESVQPVGEGDLERQFRQLCDRLRAEGYFDPLRKRPLPLVPSGVAVITSRSSAAWQDVLDTRGRRWSGCPLYLVDVRVQGDGAAAAIAAALRRVTKQAADVGIDVVILTRGGGSAEDLWAFNERVVADAVFASGVPVVAAVGHESDTTVAELVADERCATPTQAAMRVVPDAAILRQQAGQISRRLDALVVRTVRQMQGSLEAVASRVVYRRPSHLLHPTQERLQRDRERLVAAQRHAIASARLAMQEARQGLPRLDPGVAVRLAQNRLDRVVERLTRQAAREIDDRVARLHAVARHLAAVGPDDILRRGFSYTEGPDGALIGSVRQVTKGDVLTTTVADGKFQSTVRPSKSGISGKSKGGRQAGDADSPGLFNSAMP